MSTLTHIPVQEVGAEELALSFRKARRESSERTVRWTRVFAFCRRVLGHIAPIGYEDEAGFHYGEMRASAKRSIR